MEIEDTGYFDDLEDIAREKADILKQLNREEAGARVCECCGEFHPDAALTPCRTMYHDNTQNVDPFLCPRCTEAHHEYWNATWAEYDSGRL